MITVCYEVFSEVDVVEGKGGLKTTGLFFENHSDALKLVTSNYFAYNFGVMGMPGGEYLIKPVKMPEKIFSSVSEVEDYLGVSLNEKKKGLKDSLMSLDKEKLVEMILKGGKNV